MHNLKIDGLRSTSTLSHLDSMTFPFQCAHIGNCTNEFEQRERALSESLHPIQSVESNGVKWTCLVRCVPSVQFVYCYNRRPKSIAYRLKRMKLRPNQQSDDSEKWWTREQQPFDRPTIKSESSSADIAIAREREASGSGRNAKAERNSETKSYEYELSVPCIVSYWIK